VKLILFIHQNASSSYVVAYRGFGIDGKLYTKGRVYGASEASNSDGAINASWSEAGKDEGWVYGWVTG
jgi:hypothetical protein